MDGNKDKTTGNSKKWIVTGAVGWGMAAVLSGVLIGAYIVNPATTSSTAPAKSAGTSPSPTSGSTTGGNPPALFTVGKAIPSGQFYGLNGKPAQIVYGKKATFVIAMATWCLYCGYTDKYEASTLANNPNVAVDIIDVAAQGGIADPGPESPAFSGHDGTGGALNSQGMEAELTKYAKTYGLYGIHNIHFLVANASTRAKWNVQTYPTEGYIGANHLVYSAPEGALTTSQFATLITDTENQ